MLLSQSEQIAKINRLELELEEVRRAASLNRDARQSGADRETGTTPTAPPVIVNLIRNGDVNHSVNSWFEDAPSGTNKDQEAANVYTHPPPRAARVTDGQVAVSAPQTLKCLASAPFLASDVGARLVIPARIVGDEDTVTTIAGFVSAMEVTLAHPLVIAADVSNLTVRFRLQKLEKKNSKTTVGTINDALKSAAQTDYAANINDPDWERVTGIVRLGSTNTIDCPFGYYRFVPGDGAGNGADFIPLHALYPGRTVFARVNLARKSGFVKPKGLLYFGIYNNHDSDLDFAHGAPFAVAAAATGAPVVSTIARYLVVIETDQNYSIVSAIAELPGSPDDTSFTAAVYNTLSWKSFAGALRYKIYRQLGNGNVFLLEGDSPTANYTDNNPATRLDTGSRFFPNPVNARPSVSAYVSTSAGDLDNLPVNGIADWTARRVVIPFPASVNLGKFSDPHLRIGLTEGCATELRDVSVEAVPTVKSLAAQFTAEMTGKTFNLRDPLAVAERNLSGTVADYVSPTQIVLSSAPGWTSENNILEINDSAAHGILIDLIGAALLPGDWAAHTEDTNGRPQAVASNPNGSSQGGVTGDGGGGGGTGEDEGGVIYPGHNQDPDIFI